MAADGPWYVPVGENRWQAFDSIAIERMLNFGAITLKTPVWRQGMDGAAPLETFEELLDTMRGDHRLGLIDVVASTHAGPWRRVAARAIDLLLIVGPGLYAIATYSDFFQQKHIGTNLSAALCLLTLIAVLVEVPLLALTGTTLGKWLMGVRLRRQNGSRIGWRGLFMRNLRLWYHGLGMGIPFWFCVNLWFSRERTGAGMLVRWDEKTLHRTRLAPTLLNRIADRLGVDWGNEGVSWKNPLTRRIATLQAGWRVFPEQTMPDQGFYVFGTHDAIVIFARDTIPLSDLELYADIVRTRTTADFRRMEQVTGPSGAPRIDFFLHGQVGEKDFDITTRIWRSGEDDYWRLVLHQPTDNPRGARQAIKVADALEATVPVTWHQDETEDRI